MLTTRAGDLRDPRRRLAFGQESAIAVFAVVTVLAEGLTAGTVAHAANGLFQTGEERSSKLESFYKWGDMLRRHYRESREISNNPSVRRWHDFIAKIRDTKPDIQIRAVNRFVNRFAYRSDMSNYGSRDYWATPREFFAKGGDSEDYAIAKYLTFKALGWKQDRLRLVVLIDQRRLMARTVLAVYHGGRRYILDNSFRAVKLDTDIKHYRPVYSINERHWWFHTGFPTGDP